MLRNARVPKHAHTRYFLNEVLSLNAQEFFKPTHRLTCLHFLNEVLSLNAQEWWCSRLFRQSDSFLNEVLSLNAQEWMHPTPSHPRPAPQ